jgi:hypothetical protein
MSVLIAYKKDDTVYMGTDTRIISHETKINSLCESGYKIQKLDNNILLGIMGERPIKQTLIAYSEIFTLDKNGKLTKKHIVKEIIPTLRKLLKEKGHMEESDGDEFSFMPAYLLIAHGGDLFVVRHTFSVYRILSFQVVGGEVADFAQSIILNTKVTDDINARIIKALDLIAKNSQNVGAPYLLIDTKELKYNIIRR